MNPLSIIEREILENLPNENVFFVFATEIASSSWAKRAVYISNQGAVARERFLAWDEFKNQKTQNPKKQILPVPVLLRKIFARNLAEENAQKGIFKSIISREFKENSQVFSQWISKIIPELKSWKIAVDVAKNRGNYFADDEDCDFALIFSRYSEFLKIDPNTKNLRKIEFFEPAWEQKNLAENCDAENQNPKKFIVFFPEVIGDYPVFCDFFLRKNENVKIISCKKFLEKESLEFKNPCENQNQNLKIQNNFQNENFNPNFQIQDQNSKPQNPNEKSEFQEQNSQIAKNTFGNFWLETFFDIKSEIKKTALHIRHLHENGIRWDEIALSAPQIEAYLPYIEREFLLYEIPYVVRSGKTILSTGAGAIFSEISDCAKENFSYNSMKAFLSNAHFPWKDEDLNENLLREGALRKCLCSFDGFDIWEKSLSAKNSGGTTERELLFYCAVKKTILEITKAKTFFDVRKAWFSLRNTLFDFEKINEKNKEDQNLKAQNLQNQNSNEEFFLDFKETNLILGRALDILSELVELEENFGAKVLNPFDFWLSELKTSVYQMKTEKNGVSIFKYKTSAQAFFKYQFVIDSSQKNLSSEISRLSFLRSEKRKSLKLSDDFDVSQFLILLYGKTNCIFSFAQNSLLGFSIAHNFLLSKRQESPQNIFNEDFHFQEKKFFNGDLNFPQKIFDSQYSFFKNFSEDLFFSNENSKNDQVSSIIMSKIQQKFVSPQKKAILSASAMRDFFPCTRKWLFSRVLKIDSDSLEAELFLPYDSGNLYHKILQQFFLRTKQKSKNVPSLDSEGQIENSSEILDELFQSILDATNFLDSAQKSPLMREVLRSQANALSQAIFGILHNFFEPFNFDKMSGGFGGFKIFSIEKKMNFEEENFVFSGALDCVLIDPNQKITLIDYKSSQYSTPKLEECFARDGNLKNFQIPMYVKLLKNDLESQKFELGMAAYFTLKTGEATFILREPQITKKGEKSKRDKTQTIQEFEEQTMKTFDAFAKIYAEKILSAQDFSPDFSKVKKFSDCADCTFKAICRTRYGDAK